MFSRGSVTGPRLFRKGGNVIMNEVLKQMNSRRSVRHYKSDMVPDEMIEAVVAAGTEAASGMNRQTPVIVAVTNKEIRDRLSAVNAEIAGRDTGDPFYGAPVVLAVVARKEGTYIYDGSLTMGNLLLAAHSLGLGACWIHRAKQTFERPEWIEWLKSLGLEGEYEGIGFCILGYPDGEEPKDLPRNPGRVIRVK